jgi:hypothetical protein
LAAVLAALLATGCSALASQLEPTPTPTLDAGLLAGIPSATPTSAATATPAAAPITLPPPQSTIATTFTPTPAYAWLAGEVRVFPGPLHYAGDLLTIEVTVENIWLLPDERRATLLLGDVILSAEPEVAYSPLREDALVFRWVWDTTEQVGTHRLVVRLPAGPQSPEQEIDFAVQVLPADQRPRQERRARWTQRNVPGCCTLNVITNTAAHRDLDLIASQAAEALAEVEARLGFPIAEKPVPITLIDNIWGNGGYAGSEIVISYVDRSYVMPDLPTTLRHELVHWAMRSQPGSPPAILSEGLAVTIAGGHYHPEPVPQRAAALLALERYIPLWELADTFWAQQHEVAYLEAAGLVTYLIETYGLPAFLDLYTAEIDRPGGDAIWLDAALNAIYGMRLDEVEREYRVWLGAQDPGDQVDDLRLTIALFDTVRRYQAYYAAYQESLPPVAEALEGGHVAEFVREPVSAENIALESLLVSAQRALSAGQAAQAAALISAVSGTLDDGDFTRDLVADYLDIVRAARGAGFEVQEIEIEDQQAVVTVTHTLPDLRTRMFVFDGERWQIEG